MKKCIKSDFKERFLWNLQQMGKMIRPFCWHQNFVPWGLSAPALGYIHVLNHENVCIKPDFEDATNEWSDKTFLLTSKLCPLGAICSIPGTIYMYKIMKKKCIKWDLKEIVLELATNDWSDKMFLFVSKFVPKELSVPASGLYTCVQSWKNCIKSDFKEIF